MVFLGTFCSYWFGVIFIISFVNMLGFLANSVRLFNKQRRSHSTKRWDKRSSSSGSCQQRLSGPASLYALDTGPSDGKAAGAWNLNARIRLVWSLRVSGDFPSLPINAFTACTCFTELIIYATF